MKAFMLPLMQNTIRVPQNSCKTLGFS